MSAEIPKAVLVTGAARRVGRAIALDLAAEGWAVAIHYYGAGEEALETVAEITSGGGQALALAADLADEKATAKLIPDAVAALGPLGGLINNAARFEDDTIATVTRQSWDAHLAVNLRAPLVLCQAFAEQLPADTSGAIVNLLDQRVWNLTPYFLSYTVSKSALWTLTRTLALALAPRIRVNAIGPGPTLPSRKQSEAQFKRQYESLPLARRTEVEEICRAVRFLLAAPSVTGQMLALDGGQHLAWAQQGGAQPPEE